MASIFMLMTKFPRFANDAAGLEKTLRLFQALSQIIIAYASPTEAIPWLQARKQFALGRRYLRFFKFIDSYALAYQHTLSSTGLSAVLETGKWSCMGTYLFLESCTILDAMDILHPPWAPGLLITANKFWFYALLFSLASAFLQILPLYSLPSPRAASPEAWEGNDDKERARRRGLGKRQQLQLQQRQRRRTLTKSIVTDACDLLIPGAITGWVPMSPGSVGMATVVSTLLSSEHIWVRV